MSKKDKVTLVNQDTITLVNQKIRLNYHDKIEEYLGDNIAMSIWECDGHYYRISECCRGYYKSGVKAGQMCLKACWTHSGLCPQHLSQDNNYDDHHNRINNSSSGDEPGNSDTE
jgi:hypothetical protein